MIAHSGGAKVDALIVEDNFGAATAIEKFIEARSGLYHVARCGSIAAAREMLALDPLIIFLDLNLSDGFGDELIPEIKHRLPACKLIIWSAYVSTRDEARLRSMGVDGFLNKPQEDSVEVVGAMLPPPRSAETEGA